MENIENIELTVIKRLYVYGEITVAAASFNDACDKIDSMIDNGLQTTDERISWGEPVYEEFSFEVDRED